MKLFKHVRLLGLCVASLGAMSVLGFGMAGSASATILFLPLSHKFPYHLAGLAPEPKLETVGGKVVSSEKVDVLVLALDKSLFDTHLRFLKSESSGAPCTNTANEGEILINLLGHLGLADPGFVPAVLLLVPSGFKFTCEVPIFKIKVTILVKGNVIGKIASPAVGADSELLKLEFNQTSAGHQEFTTFLLGSQTLTNQFEEASENEGAFEQSAQSGPAALLHALPGQGPFLLILP